MIEWFEALSVAGKVFVCVAIPSTLILVIQTVMTFFGFGDGGETQAPMARAVSGGLSSSTFITLFFIPAVYSVAESLFRRKKKEEIAG